MPLSDGVFAHAIQGRAPNLHDAIELIGEKEVREHGAALKLEIALAGAVIFFEQFRADDVARHQVRGELDAAEVERERFAERAHE